MSTVLLWITALSVIVGCALLISQDSAVKKLNRKLKKYRRRNICLT